MSRFYHSHYSGEVIHIINEVNHMGTEQAKELYGIEIYEDGTVYDPTYNEYFDGVASWAAYTVEQESVDYEDDAVHGKQTHDDYY